MNRKNRPVDQNVNLKKNCFDSRNSRIQNQLYVQRLTFEKRKLIDEIKNIREDYEENQIVPLLMSIDEMKSRLEESIRIQKELDEKNNQSISDLTKLKNENDFLNDQICDFKNKEVVPLQKKLNETFLELKLNLKTNGQLNEDNKKLNDENKKLNDENKKLNEDNKKLKKKHEILTNDNCELVKIIESKSSENQTLVEKNCQLVQENSKLVKENNELKRDWQDAKLKNRFLEQNVKNSQTEIDSLKRQAKEKSEIQKELSEKNNQLCQENEYQKKVINNLTETNNQLVQVKINQATKYEELANDFNLLQLTLVNKQSELDLVKAIYEDMRKKLLKKPHI